MKLLGISGLLLAGTVNASSFVYLEDQATGYSANGAPLNRVNISSILPRDTLNHIYSVLPESTVVDPALIASDVRSNIEIRRDFTGYATVDLTFLNEGAGYKNSLGYYIYDIDAAPVTPNDIAEHVIVFPNASKPSGGDLVEGDTVDLKVQLRAGQGLGFVLIQNGYGYTGPAVKFENNKIYTHRELNSPALPQTVMFLDELNEFFVLGFEDILGGGDKDYNDLLMSLNVTPYEAVIPGTTPLPPSGGSGGGVTNYPSLTGKATLLFEDLWPSIGDYDFNDIGIEYNMQRFLVGADNLSKLTGNFKLISYGASYHNGFALHLPGVDKANVKSVSLTRNGSPVSHPVIEDAASELVIVFSPDLKAELDTDCARDFDCMNYSLSIEFNSPVSKDVVGLPPFDPFIFAIDGQPHGGYENRGWEVHLKEFSGTSLFNSSYMGTQDDNSNAVNSFVSGNNMPWAVNIADKVFVPKEKIDISVAYPQFVQWVTSSGLMNTQWYKVENATTGSVIERN